MAKELASRFARKDGDENRKPLWRTLLACRVGTHADAWAAPRHKSRHECRLGTQECVRHKNADCQEASLGR